MLTKPVGTLVKHHHSNHKLYQTQTFNPKYDLITPTNPHQSTRKQDRTKSVGKIYSRKSSLLKDNFDRPMNTYDRLINYN